jgi:hypothetical protein
MFPDWLRNGSAALAALALSSLHAFAAKPAESPLLRLVPANVEIVAGIEDPHHNDQSARLLIVTHNDNAFCWRAAGSTVGTFCRWRKATEVSGVNTKA